MEDGLTELKATRISVVSHVVLSVIGGYMSFYLSFVSTIVSIAAGIALVIAFGFGMERVVGKKGIKWWLGNGVIIYIFLWIVSWTFFLNL